MINMKRLLFTTSFLFSIALALSGQVSDTFVSACIMNIGKDAKYLKDYRIELGKATTANQRELRYKTNISLWKNTKYRFTMCSTDDSKGQLFVNLKDNNRKIELTSYDRKTGRTYQFVDFVCNKSGIYELSYDFTNGQGGSGVGVVSIVK